MPEFTYLAKQGPKKILAGVIEADTMDHAIAKIVQLGYSPLEVRDKVHQNIVSARPVRWPWAVKRYVPASEVTLFTRMLADLVDAGVPLLQALRVVLKQANSPQFRDILGQVHDAVKDGSPLSDALAQHRALFSNLYINLVRSGEVSGALALVLKRLAELREKDQEIVSQVKTSLIYPALIMAVAGLSLAVIFTFVIPNLAVIFEDMDTRLPWPTRMVLGLSDVMIRFGWLLALGVAGGVAYFRKWHRSPAGKRRWDQWCLKVPVLGPFIKTAEVSRFVRTLGTLLDNGVVIVTALESVAKVLDNEVLKEDVQRVTQDVANGASLTSALKSSPLFPDAAISMVAVGEESGNPQRGLFKLAEYYEAQTQRSVRRMAALIEPLLILGLGLVVGLIFIAMMMPILKMNITIR